MSGHGTWLHTRDVNGKEHVLYLPEWRVHVLAPCCACRPRIEDGVIVHTVITRAYGSAMRGRESWH